jgi:hypothetical protein
VGKAGIVRLGLGKSDCFQQLRDRAPAVADDLSLETLDGVQQDQGLRLAAQRGNGGTSPRQCGQGRWAGSPVSLTITSGSGSTAKMLLKALMPCRIMTVRPSSTICGSSK